MNLRRGTWIDCVKLRGWFEASSCAALAQYKTCRQILAEELGVEPLPETQALYHRLKTRFVLQRPASTQQAWDWAERLLSEGQALARLLTRPVWS